MYQDVNVLLGHWPFRKIRKHTLEHLRQVHKENGISGGYVSSINSIFYNDPFEGDEELHEIIRGTEYKHILTVNPMLPGWQRDIVTGIERFGIHGVRIYPTYHDYSLLSPEVSELCAALKTYQLPLFVTKRLEDERLEYILKTKPLDVSELRQFVSGQPDLDIVLLNIRFNEIMAMEKEINSLPRLYFDTSGLKDRVFVVEDLLRKISAEKIVYGSQHPLYTLKSTFFVVDKAEIGEDVKRGIFGGHARFLQRG